MATQTTNNARLAALKVIHAVFDEGAYANIALTKYLTKTEMSDVDRRFLTELVYGTVKAKGTIDWILSQNVSRPLNKVSPAILNILRLGVYQIYYLSKIPVSAACNEAVKLAKKFGHPGTVKFVNGVLRNIIRNKDVNVFPSLKDDPVLHIALNYTHPRWLVQRWITKFGQDNTVALCEFNNTSPSLSIRVNTLKITRDELIAKLTQEGFEVSKSTWSKDGIIVEKMPSFAILMEKYGQYIYMQDESSMLVAEVLAPKAGDTVIDVCSAPGGKTTHIAALMNNEGKVIATDIHEHKLKLIEDNAKRLGISIINPQEQDATEDVEKWGKSADCVLVDAPCSGLGVLRRRAEARWNKKINDIRKLPALQEEILNTASNYVKPGGRLVYSTCTLEEEENSGVVEKFLATHKDFHKLGFKNPKTGESVEELQLLPFKDAVDGFYICLLGRK